MISYASLATLDACMGRYDIVHFHALGPATLSFFPRLAGAKTVVTVHGLDWDHGKWGRMARTYLKFGEWAAAKLPTNTIVVSTVLSRYLQQKHNVIPAYIPNGVPISPALDLGEIGVRFGIQKHRYVLFVGRLMPGKNIHQVIEAYHALKTDMRLLIVGGGAGRPDYEEQIHRLAAGDSRIVITGPIYGDAVRRLFSNAYLFVLPSATEGLPISLLEALSFGTPTLASDIAANCEVLQFGAVQCGFTFPVGKVAALTDALQTLVDNPSIVEDKASLGRAAVAEKYNWDQIVDSLERVYLGDSRLGPYATRLPADGERLAMDQQS
jgi:glycosyltransferase involved in cell wall biosynthesis